jgi:hypothetical protein
MSSRSTRGRCRCPRSSSARARTASSASSDSTSGRATRARSPARLLVAQLDGQEVDGGTAAEIGYATALGLPCIAVRSDLRQSGEPGMTVNLQVEAFIAMSGGFITRSLDELVERLGALRSAGRSS